METVTKKVCLIISEVLETEITAESSVETVDKWDSLNYLTIVAELEEQFALEFDAEELPELTSVKKISGVIAGKLG